VDLKEIVSGSAGTPGRFKDWLAPDDCIACPRKMSQIANDRCLEYQAMDGCRCPNAATRSVRATLEADGTLATRPSPGRRRRG
jgi:hypothetical protein